MSKIFSVAHNADADQIHGRKNTHIMGEPDLRILDVPLSCFSLKLPLNLIHHPEAGGTDGMPVALEPAVRLVRDLPVEVEEAVPHLVSCIPAGEIHRSS